jgi:hypothetical protein
MFLNDDCGIEITSSVVLNHRIQIMIMSLVALPLKPFHQFKMFRVTASE